ncbi:DUF6030 family protein [Rhizobium sp. L80/93]|uniref:DUF6030 family protein n=1 Tax=unclassified Rhizobium TaxID=2613769 RepID=UPI001ADC903F|nr:MULTISPECIES: DUF6030 family protein [unclassified Rhizobium]MBO9136970.1 hypothetical protein [Rhizobium sp. B209b/85]MBO9188045.1 hypothetical protein [Rhizobium sp. E27B/91]QXZ99057.1 hypothetical protein J5289_21400 [Rhizobium sp. B230/85]
MAVGTNRGNIWLFWTVLTGIVVAIITTALLANDKRGLRQLVQRYHITWISIAPPVTTAPMAAARRGKRLPFSREISRSNISRHLFEDFHVAASAPVRRWRVSGDDLCRALSSAGLNVSSWHEGDLYSSTFECSSQTDEVEAPSAGRPSLFVLVRGTASGDVSSVRIKSILPDDDEGMLMRDQFQTLVAILFNQAKWTELKDILPQIWALENVKQSSYGSRIVFSHEFTDVRRFNLILDLHVDTPEQRLTTAYFDRGRWLKSGPVALER